MLPFQYAVFKDGLHLQYKRFFPVQFLLDALEAGEKVRMDPRLSIISVLPLWTKTALNMNKPCEANWSSWQVVFALIIRDRIDKVKVTARNAISLLFYCYFHGHLLQPMLAVVGHSGRLMRRERQVLTANGHILKGMRDNERCGCFDTIIQTSPGKGCSLALHPARMSMRTLRSRKSFRWQNRWA